VEGFHLSFKDAPIMSNLAPTGVNKILVEKYGYEWVNGKAWAPGTAPEAEIPAKTSQEPVLISIPDPDPVLTSFPDPTLGQKQTPVQPTEIDPLPVPEGPAPSGINKILVEKYGYEWVDGKAWEPGTAPLPEPPIVIDPIMPDPLPNPEAPVHDSRFDTVDNAIEFAEANGQGDLSVAEDGTITNSFGETMVYDSTGNLAPAPRDTPIMDPGIIF